MSGRLARAVCLLAVPAAVVLPIQPVSARVLVGDGTYQRCDVPAPKPNEKVVVVSATSEHTRTNLVIGIPANKPWYDGYRKSPDLVDVVVGETDRPLYVFVHDVRGAGTIFRFSGNTQMISRVVTFGETVSDPQSKNPNLIGVVGVPREKVSFAPIVDMKHGYDISPYCVLWQVFKNVQQDRIHPFKGGFLASIVNRLLGYPFGGRPSPATYVADHLLHLTKTGSVTIPPASSQFEVWDRDISKAGRLAETQQYREDQKRLPNMTAAELEAYEHPGGMAMLTPGDVVAPPGLLVETATKLPDLVGVMELENQGLMHRTGPKFQEVYRRWDETVSAPHRNKFQPDLMLSLPVDYVVTGRIELPVLKRKIYSGGEPSAWYTVILVDNGVSPPEVPAESRLNTCIIFADGRMMTPCNQIDPRYAQATAPKAAPEDAACRVMSPAPEGTVAAVSVFAGRHPTDPSVVQMTRGRIDLHVKRPGKVFLYLINQRDVDWHITAEANSEITGAMIVSGAAKVTGLPPGVPIVQVPPMQTKPMHCQKMLQLMMTAKAERSPLAADMLRAFLALAGRGFDLLLSKPFPGDLSQSLLVAPDLLKDYTSYTVE